MKKPLCPILLIGFPAPEEGQRDLRRCTKECALYDEEEDTCAVNALLEQTRMLNLAMQELPEMIYEASQYYREDSIDEF